MRLEEGEMEFEHGRMFSTCSQANPDLQCPPNSQTTRTTGPHWLCRLCGSQPKCQNYVENFLKFESVQPRKCYTTVSSIDSLLPTVTLCSNMLHLILNLCFFSWGKRSLRFQTRCDFAMPSIPRLCQLLFILSVHYLSAWGNRKSKELISFPCSV